MELGDYKKIIDEYFKGKSVVSAASVPYLMMASRLAKELPQVDEQRIQANGWEFDRSISEFEKDFLRRFWTQLGADFSTLLDILKSADPDFPVEAVYRHFCQHLDDRLQRLE